MADTLTANYKWTKPEVGASQSTWGTKWNANLDGIDAQIYAVNQQLTALAGSAGQLTKYALKLQKADNTGNTRAEIDGLGPGGQMRWAITVVGALQETGSNLGSNFQIHRYSDAGTELTPAPLQIQRNTGIVSIGAYPANYWDVACKGYVDDKLHAAGLPAMLARLDVLERLVAELEAAKK